MSFIEQLESPLKATTTIMSTLTGRTDKRLRRKTQIATKLAKLPANPSNTQAIKFGEEQLTLTYFTMMSGLEAGSIRNMGMLLECHRKLGGTESDWAAMRGAYEHFSYDGQEIGVKRLNRLDVLLMILLPISMIALVSGTALFLGKATQIALASTGKFSLSNAMTIATAIPLSVSFIFLGIVVAREIGMRVNAVFLRKRIIKLRKNPEGHH